MASGSGNVLVINSDMSATRQSDPLRLNSIIAYSVQAVVTGAAALTGDLRLQMSNDDGRTDGGGAPTIANWTDIAGSTISVTGNDTFAWDVGSAGYKWARLVWTRTGGSGTLNARWFAKV